MKGDDMDDTKTARFKIVSLLTHPIMPDASFRLGMKIWARRPQMDIPYVKSFIIQGSSEQFRASLKAVARMELRTIK